MGIGKKPNKIYKNNDTEIKDKSKSTVFSASIADTFDSLLRDVQKTIQRTGHKYPVDIGLEFDSVVVGKLGFLIISKTGETSMRVKLATRITKDN